MGRGRPNHSDHVREIALSGSAAAKSRLAASWHRSMVKHGLDPEEHRRPNVVTDGDLRQRKDRNARFLSVTAPRLDALYALVAQSGCGVLLTDAEGVVLDRRCSDADADVFQDWGLMAGADWSEAAEGTNGIGTCLTEERHLIIDRDEHFHARNTAMSCMDAPIYGPDGRIVAALDVSSARADQTEGYNKLIGATVSQFARTMEADFFRACFPDARVVVAGREDDSDAVLLAVDADDLVIGATRGARRTFGLTSIGDIAPVPARDLLGQRAEPEEGQSGFDRAERAALKRALARSGGNVSAAARALGIGRATMYRRMNRLGLDG